MKNKNKNKTRNENPFDINWKMNRWTEMKDKMTGKGFHSDITSNLRECKKASKIFL